MYSFEISILGQNNSFYFSPFNVRIQINARCSPNELLSVYETLEIFNNNVEGVDIKYYLHPKLSWS